MVEIGVGIVVVILWAWSVARAYSAGSQAGIDDTFRELRQVEGWKEFRNKWMKHRAGRK